MNFWKWLLYLTNNEKTSHHEQLFDVIFLIINTTALIFGIFLFIAHDQPEWVPILIIEYTWAFDNMRNNRNY
ncbi:MAG: hypothetical protein NT155_00845 [Candidatus Staskawiczbacteria bacterium]|nr:hypothetical protein [Candidatus Staskawiczbacteria bacterium]